MARPTKQGIDYFPLDVQFDDKVELFLAETGAEGLGILVTVWQLIYQNQGYFVDDGDDLCLLIRRRIMSDIPTIRAVIDSAIKRGIFNEEVHIKHKILTSKAIQNRYIIGSRKKKVVSVVKNYLLIDVSDAVNVVYSAGNATKEEVKEEEKGKEEVNNTGDKSPICPHQEIINLYHDILPTNPCIKTWTEKRKKYLQARWRENKDRQNLEWWAKFFRYVSQSKFLTGTGEKDTNFGLEWLITESNFVKVIEGNYHNE